MPIVMPAARMLVNIAARLRLRAAGDPLIAAFDLDGLEEAVAPLRDSCGWE